MMRLLIAVAACCGVLALTYFPFFNHLEPNEVGIARNWATGELFLQRPGWHVTSPTVSVARVDTRPLRVCITTAGQGFNCRLTQFVPDAYEKFVAVEGFYYYWWANRLSLNLGYDEEYRGMRDLLRGYSYSIKHYPFVTTLREYDGSG